MGLDPDIVRGKSRQTVARWLAYAGADALYDDFRADEAQAAIDRRLEGGR
jgi:hypothetical protein